MKRGGNRLSAGCLTSADAVCSVWCKEMPVFVCVLTYIPGLSQTVLGLYSSGHGSGGWCGGRDKEKDRRDPGPHRDRRHVVIARLPRRQTITLPKAVQKTCACRGVETLKKRLDGVHKLAAMVPEEGIQVVHQQRPPLASD
ncbi:unnamed protein product [Protopolystoma xenopodis]|uniref:Uncharacterized protein n=1 Tax=Protopolystoma xenopodis TaxID=117903 RepID=A0A3S4ZMI3_9PLAT|nr:unnamed protein product [Protopolystoma xenopodis]